MSGDAPPSASSQARGGHAHLTACAIEGCERVRKGRLLCALHAARIRAGRPLIADHEAVGQRPSGFGLYGVVIADEQSILCHECGRAFRMITAGHLRTHGLTPEEYRLRHGLARRVGLCCGEYAEAHRAKVARLEEEQGFVTAGTERVKRLGRVGSEAARLAVTSDAGKAARAAGLRRAAAERGTVRACHECGALMPSGPQWRKAVYCSTTCGDQSRRRAAWRRAAKRAGEPLTFVRTPGDGARLSPEAVAHRLGIKPSSIRKRVLKGTLPLHDGRTDGEPWWWETTV